MILLLIFDTFLVTVLANETVSAQSTIKIKEIFSILAWQWKIHFNAEETEELIFSVKMLPPVHPIFRLVY